MLTFGRSAIIQHLSTALQAKSWIRYLRLTSCDRNSSAALAANTCCQAAKMSGQRASCKRFSRRLHRTWQPATCLRSRRSRCFASSEQTPVHRAFYWTRIRTHRAGWVVPTSCALTVCNPCAPRSVAAFRWCTSLMWIRRTGSWHTCANSARCL